MKHLALGVMLLHYESTSECAASERKIRYGLGTLKYSVDEEKAGKDTVSFVVKRRLFDSLQKFWPKGDASSDAVSCCIKVSADFLFSEFLLV
jgi:hypothetical protein